MAEEIVSCTSCGKKFRIPEGSPPTGSFACTACDADVSYGDVGKPSGRPRSRDSGRGAVVKGGSNASKRAAAGEAKKAGRGTRRARGRRAAEPEPEAQDGRGRRRAAAPEKESKTLPIIAAIMGVVLLAFGLAVAFTSEEPDYDKQAADALAAKKANEQLATGSSGISSSDGTPQRPTPASTGTDVTQPIAPPPVVVATSTEPEDESGIGGVKGGDPSSRAHNYQFFFSKFHRSPEECFVDVEPVEGTTDAEIAHLRELTDTACDFDSGASGMKAESDVIKVGRKAMPFLLNQLVRHWNASKWNERNEQWAAWKIQKLMKQITKKDGPPSEFVAVFQPRGGDVGPDKFQRAATMWIAWWHGEGQFLESFTPYPDTE